jgi:hypothetical protein
MKIAIAYETSQGLFWARAEAELKKNRSKDTEASYHNHSDAYEQVREVYVLVADVEHHGIGKVSRVFRLNQVEVQ